MHFHFVVVFFVISRLNFVITKRTKVTPPDTFPKDFIFGVATAAYQIEGAWNEDGKSENIWDHVTHQNPNFISDGQNADIACDSYHHWKEDASMVNELKLKYYRFSISWSRLLPTGDSNYVNPHAVRYYKNLLKELVKYNIVPVATLYHWDLPQILQELGGWTNIEMANYFENYAHTAFELFGKDVEKWITFSDPFEICQGGYGEGTRPPLIKSSGIGDYLCGKTVLLAHGKAYRNYYKYFHHRFLGKVGISVGSTWYEPSSNETDDYIAAERMRYMHYGWFLNPIIHGEYPEIMIEQININSQKENYTKSRLPDFTSEDMKQINNSCDFVGINHFKTMLVSHSPANPEDPVSFFKDAEVTLEPDFGGWATKESWLHSYAWSFRHQLQWFQEQYNNKTLYVTGIGHSDDGEILDIERIDYYNFYFHEILTAIHTDKVNVQAFFAWSLMDSMDWTDGYRARYGLYYIDFSDPNRTRTAKSSAKFYTHVAVTKRIKEFTCSGCN